MLEYTTRYLLPHITLLSALSAGLSGCNGTTLGHFDVDETLPETRVEGNAVIGLLPEFFPAMTLDVSSSEEFQSEDFDFLTSIQLDELTLIITASSTDENEDSLEDGEADNFDFLSGIEIYIESEFDGESQRALIGFIDADDPQLSAGAQSIDFTLTGTDILSYVEADAGYAVQIEASGEAPPDAVIFGGDVVYRVGVGFR